MDLIHELKKAARQGNGDRIRWLLHDKPSAEVAAVLNDTDYFAVFQTTVLDHAMLAAKDKPTKKNLGVVKMLLGMGAKLSKGSGTLRIAVLGPPEILATLLTHPKVTPEDRQAALTVWADSPLFTAVVTRDVEAVKMLVAAGAPPYTPHPSLNRSAFGTALFHGYTDVAEAILEQGPPRDLAVIEDCGHKCGYLGLAVIHPANARLVPQLLAFGCDPRAGNPTALLVAIHYRNVDGLAKLLEDPRALEDGQRALRKTVGMAYGESSQKLVNVLVAAGVSPEPLLRAHAQGKATVHPSCVDLFWAASPVNKLYKLRFLHETGAGLLAKTPKMRRLAQEGTRKLYRLRREQQRRLPGYEVDGTATAGGVLRLVVGQMSDDVFDRLVELM